MAIEVLYLDRSAGLEVTPHRLPVVDANGQERKGVPTIRLLYRPCVSLWRWTRWKAALICSRGHYDLLYKTEDIVEMSRHALSNPVIRLVSAPQISVSANAQFPHDENLDILTDIPGFSSGGFPMPYTPTSAEPYQSNPTPRTMTPATPMYQPYQGKVETFSSTPRTTTPATPVYPCGDPAVKEEHSPKTTINSPIPSNQKELPIQADFKPRTKQQRKYDRRLIKAQGEPIPSDVLKE